MKGHLIITHTLCHRSVLPLYDEITPLIPNFPNRHSASIQASKIEQKKNEKDLQDDKEDFDKSEEHKLKDFQLVRVPQKAVISKY